MAIIKLAIRELVEFTLRSGDIKATFLSSKRAVDGTKAHSRYQKKMKKALDDLYESEVSISYEHTYIDDTVILSGRMDGVDFSSGGTCIDEIKSTNLSLDSIEDAHEMHLAQVKLYAYIYGKMNQLKEISYKIIYIELDSYEEKIFEFHVTIKALELYFYHVIGMYMAFYHKVLDYERDAKASIEQASFPFGTYRKGQKTLLRRIYETIDQREVLFARAPTGIGKTIGTLYPALKALGRDKTEKIFYLTAKTIGKKVAADTLDLLLEQGVGLKYVVITAKEKSCINDEFSCKPEDCPFAKGHYDRINEAVNDIYDEHNCFTYETIREYATKHQVCPYEFSLDLALFSMVIICDYNYAFDPQAMFRRFFVEGSGKYTILVDEAHNLVDRAREMYSAQIDKNRVLEVRRLVKAIDQRLYTIMGKLNKFLLEQRKSLDEIPKGKLVTSEAPEEMTYLMRNIQNRIEKIFALHQQWEHMPILLDFFFECYGFVKSMEYYDEHYVTYYEKYKSNLRVKVFCLNPSRNIQNVLSMLYGAVFFSATLTPFDYYTTLLCEDEGNQQLLLGSPFPSEHLNLLIDDRLSTRYVDRPSSIEPIIKDIHQVIRSKVGHYIVYFPSYKYMMDVLDVYEPIQEEVLIIQRPGQSEKEKEAFIDAFHDIGETTKVGFAVMGGMFGEGIDLTGEKLSGVVVVGVGLPQICFERDIIKNYFSKMYHQGFEYAYTYPGMNKVMQSAGRVIRTMSDKGIVLLIDQRFKRRDYQQLFPYEWRHREFISQIRHIDEYLTTFWEENQ